MFSSLPTELGEKKKRNSICLACNHSSFSFLSLAKFRRAQNLCLWVLSHNVVFLFTSSLSGWWLASLSQGSPGAPGKDGTAGAAGIPVSPVYIPFANLEFCEWHYSLLIPEFADFSRNFAASSPIENVLHHGSCFYLSSITGCSRRARIGWFVWRKRKPSKRLSKLTSNAFLFQNHFNCAKLATPCSGYPSLSIPFFIVSFDSVSFTEACLCACCKRILLSHAFTYSSAILAHQSLTQCASYRPFSTNLR